jgi:hypothetical protein
MGRRQPLTASRLQKAFVSFMLASGQTTVAGYLELFSPPQQKHGNDFISTLSTQLEAERLASHRDKGPWITKYVSIGQVEEQPRRPEKARHLDSQASDYRPHRKLGPAI